MDVARYETENQFTTSLLPAGLTGLLDAVGDLIGGPAAS